MIVFLIFLVAVGGFLQAKMARQGLRQLNCAIRTEDYLAEPNGPITMVFTVENQSRLPVLFLRCRCAIPNEAEYFSGTGKVTAFAHSSQYSFDCFLLPRQRLEHRFQLTIPKRGRYLLSGLRLAAGDFLGISESVREFPGGCSVVILPERAEGAVPEQVFGGLMGQRSVRRWLHEDPVLSVGFREYTGREPLKAVSWNRSLQSGTLMVRQMDHTAEDKVTVLLSLDAGSFEQMERLFSLSRSMCEELERQRLPFAFRHNGMLQNSVGVLPPVEAGLGQAHLNRILEGLGGALPHASASLDALIYRTLQQGEDSCCYLLLVPSVTPKVHQLAAALEARKGVSVQLISGEVGE